MIFSFLRIVFYIYLPFSASGKSAFFSLAVYDLNMPILPSSEPVINLEPPGAIAIDQTVDVCADRLAAQYQSPASSAQSLTVSS
jgi:hypothetical protein